MAPKLLHGECVAIGMVLEAKLAQKMGHLASSSIVGRVIKCLQSYNLPTQLPSSMDFDALLQKHDCPFDFCFFFAFLFGVLMRVVSGVRAYRMSVDKKNANNRIRCVILKTIGQSFETPIPVGVDALRHILLPAVAVVPARVSGTISVPGSKSISNRALILAALGKGTLFFSIAQREEM
jgi:pentafunctional AROM polypeptide